MLSLSRHEIATFTLFVYSTNETYSSAGFGKWPWQDLNLQSSAPKTNAVNMRPQGQVSVAMHLGGIVYLHHGGFPLQAKQFSTEVVRTLDKHDFQPEARESKATHVGFEPTWGDLINLADRCLSRSAKVSVVCLHHGGFSGQAQQFSTEVVRPLEHV